MPWAFPDTEISLHLVEGWELAKGLEGNEAPGHALDPQLVAAGVAVR